MSDDLVARLLNTDDDAHWPLREAAAARIAELEARQWPQPTDPETQRAMKAGAEALKRVAVLEAALRPFANYADDRKVMPPEWPITLGSAMARRQLTMGDCYAARAALTGGHHAD